MSRLRLTLLIALLPSAAHAFGTVEGGTTSSTSSTATAVSASDGTAASPSITFSSDTNTGMYRIGADSIGLSTGGTLRFTLNTTGLTLTLPFVSSVASGGDAITLTRGAYLVFHTGASMRYDPTNDWLRVAMPLLTDNIRLANNSVIRNQDAAGVSRMQFDSYTNGADATSTNNPAIMFRSQAATSGALTALDSEDQIICAANVAGTCVWGVSNVGAMKTGSQALMTCASGFEGWIVRDSSAGAATGNPTRMCMCRSAGASDYTWVNMVTGTVGTNTTCSN
jgi:hypothetical protein